MKKFIALLFATVLFVACDETQPLENPNGTPDEEHPNIPNEELPYFCDLENFEGWSNVRISQDGAAIFIANDCSNHYVEKCFLLIPTNLGIVSIYGEFDEMGFPKYLAFDDEVIFIDRCTDTSFDASVVVGGEFFWTATELELPQQSTRSWCENNWVRNTVAVGGVVSSAVGVGIGVALTGSGVGALTGLVTITSSCNALEGNLETLFGPAEEQLNGELSQCIQDMGWNHFCDKLTAHEESYLNKWFKTHMDNLDRLSWLDLALDLVDEKWGRTVTKSQKQLALLLAHRNYVVETGVVKEVTEHTAELYGYISPELLFPLDKYFEIEYGITLYPSADPSLRTSQYDIVGNGGSFSLFFRGLERDTEYTYFAYYHDKDNMLSRYGETRTFKTEGGEHPYAVDLGLSVKWASCNVGASSPEEYGDYFAWGETLPKSNYYIQNCNQYWIDYDGDGSPAISDDDRVLDIRGTQYDAACMNWGGSWRMPTETEIKELRDKCTCVYAIINEVKGLIVTGPNGERIFLPAAGVRGGDLLYEAGVGGRYWSATRVDGQTAYGLNFVVSDYSSDPIIWCITDGALLEYGCSVRPVLD